MAVAFPAVVACGDVVGVVFDGEDEAVLFVPNSGDVLISALAQWQRLIGHATEAGPEQSASDAIHLADLAHVANLANSPPAHDLRSTLLQLGVKLD